MGVFPVITRTGHKRLPDGRVARLDVECGCWVGRLFAPGCVCVLAAVRGEHDAVEKIFDSWG